ncbi:MAG: hypothetical protein LC131_05310 [Anaerolineae bacterium]|nr:hypothetical protein [Anaerolineae bacterium]
MYPSATSTRPERVRRALCLSAAALLLAIVATVALIAAKTFDPKPFGRLLRIDQPGTFEQSEVGERVIALDAPWSAGSPPERFTVRLRAAQAGGDPDSGYGLVLGDGDNRLVVAASPLGYVAVREEKRGGQPVYLTPWSTWSHVRPGEEANEIWLNVARNGGRATITALVNREYLWQGDVAWPPDRADLWLVAFSEPVAVEFRSLEWFAGPDD